MATQKAGTVLVNLSNKKIALVYRRDNLGYEFPKGHIEEGETLEECAVRETEEETGRKNYIVEKLEKLNYITGKGEEVELHMYLAIDDGRTHEIIEEDRSSRLRGSSCRRDVHDQFCGRMGERPGRMGIPAERWFLRGKCVGADQRCLVLFQ